MGEEVLHVHLKGAEIKEALPGLEVDEEIHVAEVCRFATRN
jgi:hypothetical protein